MVDEFKYTPCDKAEKYIKNVVTVEDDAAVCFRATLTDTGERIRVSVNIEDMQDVNLQHYLDAMTFAVCNRPVMPEFDNVQRAYFAAIFTAPMGKYQNSIIERSVELRIYNGKRNEIKNDTSCKQVIFSALCMGRKSHN